MKKIELLSPAGDMERLKAAVSAGCDAVYLGLTSYSARAFAGNFNRDELKEAVSYCHIRGVKVYVTMNTVLTEMEMERAKDEVDFLYHNDVDALLIQDFGLFDYVRTCYPDFDIHCSTQMHIHNLAGVYYMQEEGAKRVVLARETPIEIVKKACKTGMEIEVFVYGALCISYSGQCLMSSSLKNRSANKGMCAQCCRLRYYKEDGSRFEDGDFILSPKDLNTIDTIPELIDAGISSLKIEGRMKRAEYVYLVTKTFREAIDAYYDGKKYIISKQRERDLLLMFNRGFTKGHLFHATTEERMRAHRPNHKGIEIGEVLSYRNHQVTVKLKDTLYQRDGLRILNEPIDTGLTAVKIEKNGKLVNMANAGDVVILPCKSEPHPKPGQILLKTSDVKLLERIQENIKMERKLPVKVTFKAYINQPFLLTVEDKDGKCVSVESDGICEKAMKSSLDRERIEKALNKTGDIPFLITSIEGVAEDIFLPVSILNETRRKAFEELMRIRAVQHVRLNEKPYSKEVPQKLGWKEKVLVLHGDFPLKDGCIEISEALLPVVNEKAADKKEHNQEVLSSISDFYGSLQHCIAGMTLNITNSYACAYFLKKDGIDGLILSSEINEEQIHFLKEAFERRYGVSLPAYQLVYGKRSLMYIKQGFTKDKNLKKMKDFNGNLFEIRYNNDVVSILEPEAHQTSNKECYGSVVILNGEKNSKEIVEKAYEEIY